MTRKSLILVVDDERQIQRFLSPSLKMEGYEVALASNAAEALDSVAREHPALVVLDLGLPDRDGKSVIAELRKKHTIPIIVLSARDDEAEKIAALDLGANDFIVKPFAIGEFLARLRAALRQHHGCTASTSSMPSRGLAIWLITTRSPATRPLSAARNRTRPAPT